MCALYTSSFLPYGRFYNRLGGNFGMLGSYMFVFMFLAFPFIRKPSLIEMSIIGGFDQIAMFFHYDPRVQKYKEKFSLLKN